jgi:hypothetical protein
MTTNFKIFFFLGGGKFEISTFLAKNGSNKRYSSSANAISDAKFVRVYVCKQNSTELNDNLQV